MAPETLRFGRRDRSPSASWISRAAVYSPVPFQRFRRLPGDCLERLGASCLDPSGAHLPSDAARPEELVQPLCVYLRRIVVEGLVRQRDVEGLAKVIDCGPLTNPHRECDFDHRSIGLVQRLWEQPPRDLKQLAPRHAEFDPYLG